MIKRDSITFTVLLIIFTITQNLFAQVYSNSILDSIQGDWSCYQTLCEKSCESCCENEIFLDIQIINDSIHFFDYPNMYFGSYPLQSKNDSLYCDKDVSKLLGYEYPAHSFKITNDSLTIADYYLFKRKSFDSGIINKLKKDSINFEYLKGRWMIVTKYDRQYDRSENGLYWHVELPFKVTHKLNFQSDHQLPSSRYLLLKVNGEYQKFYIEYLSERRLTVVTGSWYTGGQTNHSRHNTFETQTNGGFAIDFCRPEDRILDDSY